MQSMVVTLSLFVLKMFLASVTGFNIIEDDIVDRRNHDTRLARLQSATLSTKVWDSGVIPVFIDNSIRSRNDFFNNVTEALRMVSSMTSQCITFPDKTDTDIDYVNITGKQDGCYSDVGHIRRQQFLNLAPRCGSIGVIMHEILHTIGLWHEQSRTDRDTYVQIDYSNIMPGQKHNFAKRNESKEMEKYVPYDFLSIMHYKYNQFAFDKSKPTIEPRPRFGVRKESLGQRNNLTDFDIQKILWLYNCASCKKYVSDNLVSIPNNNSFRVRSTVNFECQNKYSLIGASTSTCGKNGNWAGAAPMCVISNLLGRFRGMIYDNCEKNQMDPNSNGQQRWSNRPWTANTEGSGPEADHTYGTYHRNKTAKGRFFYFNSTGLDKGQSATLRTLLLNMKSRRPSNVSIVFFYHMFGKGIGNLSVTLHTLPPHKWTVLWTSVGSTSLRAWYCAHITAQKEGSLNLRGYYRVEFKAVSGSNENATIAIDDIFIGPAAEVDKFATLQKCGEQEREQSSLSDYRDPPIKYK